MMKFLLIKKSFLFHIQFFPIRLKVKQDLEAVLLYLLWVYAFLKYPYSEVFNRL